ncbi:MAG: hypothetical protein RLZZ436_3776 [Planctomycetota bacterium]
MSIAGNGYAFALPALQQGLTVNLGKRVGAVREVRSEKSEVRSSIAVRGVGSRV